MSTAAAALFVGATGAALWRGLIDAGGAGDFPSYLAPVNSLRVFKPLVLVLLLLPLLRAELAKSPQRAMRRVGAGMAIGLAVVATSVLWERIAYPGLTDFSKPYRAVGLFWEMHVGGAAIDAYLAMASPFAVWALRSARTPLRWVLAAALALLATYAGLTTFSRGVYLAAAVPLLVLGVTGSSDGSAPRWRRRAGQVLAVIVLVEAVAVVWTGSFLLERISRSDRDLRSRIAHWTRGVRLLQQPADFAFGIGLGRLPSHFTRFVEGYEFPGAVRPVSAVEGGPGVRIAGPASRGELAGLYSLTQRVPLLEGARYHVEFDHRVGASTGLSVKVCELHLLYERACQSRILVLGRGNGEWQHVSVALAGPSLEGGQWFAPRMAVFEISVLNAAAHADIADLRLHDGGGTNLLRNGDFAQEIAHWFPAAQAYFVPWHMDNLYLEILVERGPLALVGFVVVVALTLRRSMRSHVDGHDLLPFLAASLGAALLIGCVSSVLDSARPAFLLFFLIAFAAMLERVPKKA